MCEDDLAWSCEITAIPRLIWLKFWSWHWKDLFECSRKPKCGDDDPFFLSQKWIIITAVWFLGTFFVCAATIWCQRHKDQVLRLEGVNSSSTDNLIEKQAVVQLSSVLCPTLALQRQHNIQAGRIGGVAAAATIHMDPYGGLIWMAAVRSAQKRHDGRFSCQCLTMLLEIPIIETVALLTRWAPIARWDSQCGLGGRNSQLQLDWVARCYRVELLTVNRWVLLLTAKVSEKNLNRCLVSM